ncbi:MAG: hypothetical protein K0R82_2348 [Flavipsychrobacter sp.]|nr:hypothetical protein [Flavipsychrobacter sp.]
MANLIFNYKRNTMSGFYRFFVPALLAIIFGTACDGPSKTVQLNTTMQKEHDALAGKNWKLEELMGEPVVGRNAAGEAYIKFGTDSNRVSGNTGCNHFFGSYKLAAPGQIAIEKVGSTKRACPNMDVETNYLKALGDASTYKLDGDVLLLGNAGNDELAKFRNASPK